MPWDNYRAFLLLHDTLKCVTSFLVNAVIQNFQTLFYELQKFVSCIKTYSVMSPNITNFMQRSFCRNGFNLWLDGCFQFQKCLWISLKQHKNIHKGFNPVGMVAMKNFLTMSDSAAFCMETITSHHDRLSTQRWLRHQSAVLNVTHFFLDFCLLPSVLHWQFLLYE
jgi:hypothetical protein